MMMPNRTYSAGNGYRYGFNGQEKSNEIKDEGNSYTAAYWEYDSRLGRRWNVDPIFRAYESPYAAFGNNPILLNDPDGLTAGDPQKHTVQEGDNLTKIAKQYNTTIDNLVTWNKIANRDEIGVNQILTVSDPAIAAAQTKTADQKTFETYPNFGQSTGWTTRSSTHKNEFEITNATSGIDVGKASMQNFDVVYLQGGLLEKIKADPDLLSKENILVDKIKTDKRYGSESFYMSGLLSNAEGKPGVGFGGQRWTSANETWSSPNRNNPLLHKSTWKVAANELTWVLRNATVKYFVEVDPQGGINIQYRLYDRLDLSKQDGRQDAYNNISQVLGFGYHTLGGGNLNLQTRAEWSTKK
jgi:LysM repeat protein